jgi:hypothetical protein
VGVEKDQTKRLIFMDRHRFLPALRYLSYRSRSEKKYALSQEKMVNRHSGLSETQASQNDEKFIIICCPKLKDIQLLDDAAFAKHG